MSDRIIQRGKKGVFYADTMYMSVHIKDCLRTTDEKIARRRLWEIKISIEEGGYQLSRKKFSYFAEQVMEDGLNERDEVNMRVHIMPHFGETKMGELDIEGWINSRLDKPKSTLQKEMRTLAKVMRKADPNFQMPKPRFKNEGKVFDESQILSRDEVEMVVRDYVLQEYKIPCLVAAYSTLRLKNVIGLRKKDVNFSEGWIRVKQSKTGKPVSIPITETLKGVFSQVKIRPLLADDLWFPGVDANAIGIQVSRSFTRAGIAWASFHSLRHFGACFLIANGVPLEVIRIIMGHADFRSTLVYARLKGDKIKEAMGVFDRLPLPQNFPKSV
jgi:integrase